MILKNVRIKLMQIDIDKIEMLIKDNGSRFEISTNIGELMIKMAISFFERKIKVSIRVILLRLPMREKSFQYN